MRVVVVVVLKEVLLGQHHQVHEVQVLQDHQDLLVVVVVVVQQVVVVHSNPSLVEALQDVVGVQVRGADIPYLVAHDEDQGADLASDSFVGVDHEVVLHVVHHEDPHEVHYVGHCEDHHDYQVPGDPGDPEAHQVGQEEPGPSNWTEVQSEEGVPSEGVGPLEVSQIDSWLMCSQLVYYSVPCLRKRFALSCGLMSSVTSAGSGLVRRPVGVTRYDNLEMVKHPETVVVWVSRRQALLFLKSARIV
ncbi:hypothetical protein E2C01_005838 [Portunus trituberculatus]|uniref:Uncharacterized protein n=1 Tax=Portunus trituberculatus TaxID=210409 RepID=A0A5B7CXN2_PORTR|nr:hypothetical protein [Portunus trituberculatus]